MRLVGVGGNLRLKSGAALWASSAAGSRIEARACAAWQQTDLPGRRSGDGGLLAVRRMAHALQPPIAAQLHKNVVGITRLRVEAQSVSGCGY